MAFRAWGRGVTLFWHAAISRKQKLPWGNILQAHASGNVIGAYLRDTRMSPKSIAAVGDEMRTWWRARQRSKSRDRRRRPGDSTPPAVPQPLAARPSPYTYPKPYAGIYTRGARGRPRPRA